MGRILGNERHKMIGQKFGRLLVIGYDEKISEQKRESYYQVRCNCGIEKNIRGKNLRQIGGTRSCGCLRDEKRKQIKHNHVGENNPRYYHGFCIGFKKFRKIVRERDIICQRCGKTVKENGRELDAHHLNGDDTNNDPKNGATLCTKCHRIVTRDGNIWRPK